MGTGQSGGGLAGAAKAVRARGSERGRAALVAGADVVGRASADARVLPGFLIAGGQRCGTTSMYQALRQQPTLFRPTWRKGVHYFDMAYGERDLRWYRSHFPLCRQLARASTRHGGDVAHAFESSPYDLFHPQALDRIATDLPDIRLLVLVRDPVERAYSSHAHARGYESEPFARALELEESRLASEVERIVADAAYESKAHRHQAYRSRGEYAAQLAHAGHLLGRERIHVVDSHRFFREPLPVLDEVLGFLGVTTRVPTKVEQHNARPRLPLDPGLARKLRAHFAPHDAALTRWLGTEPTWVAEGW
ncbi:sulfotransferase [Nostocoides jenkinsii]|uniref:Putative deacetylase sulfotransferase n=1 Tax=Nostocoides jenkinsii Ben 74 TaxID=1193518 RepID=A0A077M8A7_9MICO|nr:sulfotransferase [Tetrasphaera jenkinsii]CCI53531.1 putative deacetylase sulfotransferase [Tetrasphaera jenkinsii Ben 74]